MANAWQTIKKLTVGQGGKTVVVEGDEATHVVLTIEEHERLLGSQSTEQEVQPTQTTPSWTPPAQPASTKLGEQGDSPTPGSIRIEDLPL